MLLWHRAGGTDRIGRYHHSTDRRINPISKNQIIICAEWVHLPSHRCLGISPLAVDWRIPMKTMILVALAVVSLGVGNAYAQGKPLSAHTGVYGSQY
jgi:hypothetical protein